jgi:hypothetical protein
MLLLELLTAFDIAMGFQTHRYPVITLIMVKSDLPAVECGEEAFN